MSKIKKIEKVYDEIRSRFDKLGGHELFYDYDSIILLCKNILL